MYEDEFELTFQVPEEESAPEPLAAPAAKPAAPVEPVVDEPTRIMTLGKTAAPAVDEPTRVITLEKPAEPPAVELPAPLRQQGIRWRCSTTRTQLLPLRWNSSCPGASPSSAM